MSLRIKTGTLAGSWYPAGAETLRGLLDRLMAEASQAPAGEPFGLIVPHAGYRYSGAVAAVAYRQLLGSGCQRVVLLAPSHRMSSSGAAVLDADAFETPLGLVCVDPETTRLAGRDPVRIDAEPFRGEHSLEIQLPFLQWVCPGATVVPMLLGLMSAADYRNLAAVLDQLADARTVFVVSSDFTHYGWRFGYEPFPAEDAESVRARLRELDMGAIAPILAGDAAEFQRYVENTGNTICGRNPITAFLTWSGPRRGELLRYQTSLDATGDYEHSVSYAAIAFRRESASGSAS